MLNGKQIVQSMPRRAKQPQAGKNNASDFGTASATAKKIRLGLFPILRGMAAAGMYRRFTSAVHTASLAGNAQPKGRHTLFGGAPGMLGRFQFNEATPMDKWCSLEPQAQLEEQQLVISLPAFVPDTAFRFPDAASGAAWCCLATIFDPVGWDVVSQAMFPLEFGAGDGEIPASQWIVPDVPTGHLAVISAAVFYFRGDALAGNVILNNKTFHPCEVVAALAF
jgi:hypothetical protein